MLSIEAATGVDLVRLLWTEYWEGLGLPRSFQGFDDELRHLPGVYSPPAGALALALLDEAVAGTVALRPLGGVSCEVKRLYVRPEFRRRGVGRTLMNWILGQAKARGYEIAYGDTLPSVTDALQMYRELGFRMMDRPYSQTPTPGAIYLVREL